MRILRQLLKRVESWPGLSGSKNHRRSPRLSSAFSVEILETRWAPATAIIFANQLSSPNGIEAVEVKGTGAIFGYDYTLSVAPGTYEVRTSPNAFGQKSFGTFTIASDSQITATTGALIAVTGGVGFDHAKLATVTIDPSVLSTPTGFQAADIIGFTGAGTRTATYHLPTGTYQVDATAAVFGAKTYGTFTVASDLTISATTGAITPNATTGVTFDLSQLAAVNIDPTVLSDPVGFQVADIAGLTVGGNRAAVYHFPPGTYRLDAPTVAFGTKTYGTFTVGANLRVTQTTGALLAASEGIEFDLTQLAPVNIDPSELSSPSGLQVAGISGLTAGGVRTATYHLPVGTYRVDAPTVAFGTKVYGTFVVGADLGISQFTGVLLPTATGFTFDLDQLAPIQIDPSNLSEPVGVQAADIVGLTAGGGRTVTYHFLPGTYRVDAPSAAFGQKPYGTFTVNSDLTISGVTGVLLPTTTGFTFDLTKLGEVTIDPTLLSQPVGLQAADVLGLTGAGSRRATFHLPVGTYRLDAVATLGTKVYGNFTIAADYSVTQQTGVLLLNNREITFDISKLAVVTVDPTLLSYPTGLQTADIVGLTAGGNRVTTYHLPAGTYRIETPPPAAFGTKYYGTFVVGADLTVSQPTGSLLLNAGTITFDLAKLAAITIDPTALSWPTGFQAADIMGLTAAGTRVSTYHLPAGKYRVDALPSVFGAKPYGTFTVATNLAVTQTTEAVRIENGRLDFDLCALNNVAVTPMDDWQIRGLTFTTDRRLILALPDGEYRVDFPQTDSSIITGDFLLDDLGLSDAAVPQTNPLATLKLLPCPNSPPLLSPISNQSGNEGGTIAFSAAGTDPDGDSLTYSLAPGAPIGALINPSTGAFSFTPSNGPAVFSVTVVVSDDGRENLAASQTFQITVNNVAPIVTALNIFAVAGIPFNNQSVATFDDPGVFDTHTATIDWGDGTSSVGNIAESNGSGVVSGTHTYSPSVLDDFSDFCGAAPPSTSKIISINITDSDLSSTTAKGVAVISSPTSTAGFVGNDLLIVGTAGDDSIVVSAAGTLLNQVNVTLNGMRTGPFAVGGGRRIIVAGLAGDDNLQVAGSVRAATALFGGPGNDRLKGGGGQTVEVGCTGNDLLIGGSANDVLIGGQGFDRIIGRAGEDILIAGFTDYDANVRALSLILTEWNSSASLSAKIARLLGQTNPPAFPFAFPLNTATVHDDGVSDTLVGGTKTSRDGTDLFFHLGRGLNDFLLNPSLAELRIAEI